MGAIIVAMPKHEDSERIVSIIRQSGIGEDTLICSSGSEILRRIEDMDISLIICTRKLMDMGYEELHGYLPSKLNMLLLTKDIQLGLYSSNIIVLQMPFRTSDLVNSARMLLPEALPKGRGRAPSRSALDKQTIDRAKMLLMARNNMTESEAYRYLQKNSMDMGRTLSETAHMIISMIDE
jgi:response regulator NasT